MVVDLASPEEAQAAGGVGTASGGDEVSSGVPSRFFAAAGDEPSDVDDVRSRYRLVATVWHAGTHASSGHYIADVRRDASTGGGATWQRFDDSLVTPVAADAPEALTKGYIFFFVHDSLMSEASTTG